MSRGFRILYLCISGCLGHKPTLRFCSGQAEAPRDGFGAGLELPEAYIDYSSQPAVSQYLRGTRARFRGARAPLCGYIIMPQGLFTSYNVPKEPLI